MIRSIVIAVVLGYALKTTLAYYDLSIECSYKSKKVWDVVEYNFTTCDLKTNIGLALGVRNATGLPSTISNEDVQIFNVHQKDILRIPYALRYVFPNLLGINIDSTNFMYLEPHLLSDLNLTYLAITNSDLSVIFEDTFYNCTSLKLVDLKGSPLRFVIATAFDDVINLRFLYLQMPCLGDNTYNGSVDSSDLANLKEVLYKYCNVPHDLLRDFQNSIYSLLKWVSHVENYNSSHNEFDRPLGQLDQCELRNEVLQNEIEILNQKIQNSNDQTCYPSGTCIFKTISDAYSCEAKLYVKTAFEQKINWTGIHANGQNNDGVMSIVIQSQVMEVFPFNIGSTFKNLKNLIVKNSGLTKIRVNDFNGLRKLENLDITGNNIARIDATSFDGLTSLQKIDLSFNNITALPSHLFEFLLNLKIINLSDNKLKQVRYDVISSANVIEEIYLMNNAIVPLDRTFIWRLKNAKTIDLKGTGCAYSVNKDVEVSFYAFYTNIIMNC